jgi:ABC-type multidrug transport system ATPase subunit
METNRSLAIDCRSLTLNYGRLEALKSVSFGVERGELFGLIGPDGAGKTTIFRILATLRLADGGEATVDGLDVVKDYRQIRNRIGYMPGRFSLYQDLTVEENLNFFATVFNTTVKQNYSLIEGIYSQIEPFGKRRAGQLSGGMKQKLALSCALIHKPSVLLLDEPTTGVDPVSRKEFWEMLKNLKRQGITILVSTPYMDETALCDRVALIQKGEILTVDTPKRISESFRHRLFAVKSDDNYSLLMLFRQNRAVRSAYSFGESLHVTFNDEFRTDDGKLPGQDGISNCRLSNIDCYVAEISPSIEDCFIELQEDK